MNGATRALALGIMALAGPLTGARAAERVVSLNLCTDQMLVLLAPRKVVALSPLARDPALSYVARTAASLPTVRASAEAVLRLQPDLVLAGPYGAQTTLALLQQERVPLMRVSLPQDFAGIRAMTRQLAQALDAVERGEDLVAAMDATLSALPRADRSLRTLVWQPRGFTAGPGTLMDAVLRAAGLTNVADGSALGLEAVLHLRPDLLVVPTAAAYPSLATTLLAHRALQGLSRREVPPPLTICAGPFSAEAAFLLAR